MSMSETSSCRSSFSGSPTPEQTNTPPEQINQLNVTINTPRIHRVVAPSTPLISPLTSFSFPPVSSVTASVVNAKDIETVMQVARIQEHYMRTFGTWAALQRSVQDNQCVSPLNLSMYKSPSYPILSPCISDSLRLGSQMSSSYRQLSAEESRSKINYSNINNNTVILSMEQCTTPQCELGIPDSPPCKSAKLGKKDDLRPSQSPENVKQNIQDLEELDKFANKFKQARLKHGFTQQDVGMALGKLYGTDFSQTTISRFEALNLSFRNMCKLKPQLEEWIKDMDKAIQDGTIENNQARMKALEESEENRRRKKRTSIPNELRGRLEQVFKENPRPQKNAIAKLAQQLDKDRDTIRVWFCNRRQKARKVDESSCGPNKLGNMGLCLYTDDQILTADFITKTVALNNEQLGTEIDTEMPKMIPTL